MSKTSAIVSVYNGEKFFQGRLENLLAQTAWSAGELEIIIVNSGSKQGEDGIARQYMAKGVPFIYIKSLREPLYVAWNRAISAATGDYIIPANVDDRLHPVAVEKLAEYLDMHDNIDLVYADSYVTDTENATWESYRLSSRPPYLGRLEWPQFEPKRLLDHYYLGPCPMWRRSLHLRFGLFDQSFQLAGDYEWALRLAAHGVKMLHVQEFLSLFYDNGMGINHQEFSAMESRRAILRWKEKLTNGERSPDHA
jgi:glycosyltransferase involved in cell wall biosynthesis